MKAAETIHLPLIPRQLSIYNKASVRQTDKKPSFPALYELTLQNRIVVETSKHDYIQHEMASMASMRARRTSI